jgi:hypothetical protein
MSLKFRTILAVPRAIPEKVGFNGAPNRGRKAGSLEYIRKGTNLKGTIMINNKGEHRYVSLTTSSRTSGYVLV